MKEARNVLSFLLLVAPLSMILTGCPFDVVHIKQIPVQFENTATIKPDFELKEEVGISLGTGYSRKLNKGTRWKYVSSISYGSIYKTTDQILTVEASNICEAYIVVTDQNLVGFFLPVEQAYSPLSKPIPLAIVEINQ